jgi:hypothetical protein
MPLYVLAIVFALLVVVALMRVLAQTKKLRRPQESPDRPKGSLHASDFPDDVYGSQERARKRSEDLEKRRLFEEAKRQRLAIAQAKRLRLGGEQRVRRYRRWWLRAVLAVLLATAAAGLAWGFLDARGLVPKSVQEILSAIAK